MKKGGTFILKMLLHCLLRPRVNFTFTLYILFKYLEENKFCLLTINSKELMFSFLGAPHLSGLCDYV